MLILELIDLYIQIIREFCSSIFSHALTILKKCFEGKILLFLMSR